MLKSPNGRKSCFHRFETEKNLRRWFHFFECSPPSLGKWSNFDEHVFSSGLVQPPTWLAFYKILCVDSIMFIFYCIVYYRVFYDICFAAASKIVSYFILCKNRIYIYISHTIHVWYIYLHLVDFYGKCREIYHTWIVWVYIYILGSSLMAAWTHMIRPLDGVVVCGGNPGKKDLTIQI